MSGEGKKRPRSGADRQGSVKRRRVSAPTPSLTHSRTRRNGTRSAEAQMREKNELRAVLREQVHVMLTPFQPVQTQAPHGAQAVEWREKLLPEALAKVNDLVHRAGSKVLGRVHLDEEAAATTSQVAFRNLMEPKHERVVTRMVEAADAQYERDPSVSSSVSAEIEKRSQGVSALRVTLAQQQLLLSRYEELWSMASRIDVQSLNERIARFPETLDSIKQKVHRISGLLTSSQDLQDGLQRRYRQTVLTSRSIPDNAPIGIRTFIHQHYMDRERLEQQKQQLEQQETKQSAQSQPISAVPRPSPNEVSTKKPRRVPKRKIVQ